MCMNNSMVFQEDPDSVVVSSLTGIVEGGHPPLQERRECYDNLATVTVSMNMFHSIRVVSFIHV